MKREFNDHELSALEAIINGAPKNLDNIKKLIYLTFKIGYVSGVGDAIRSSISALDDLVSEDFKNKLQ